MEREEYNIRLKIDQQIICQRFGADFLAVAPAEKVGISATALADTEPLNGLRHIAEADSCGWYIWGGEEFSRAVDFFKPLHVMHLPSLLPEVLPFLGLGYGWRFLIDRNGYVDVWFDEKLL